MLKDILKKFGDSLVPENFIDEGFALGKWVGSLRQNRRKPVGERKQQLDDLGFIWDVKEHRCEVA